MEAKSDDASLNRIASTDDLRIYYAQLLGGFAMIASTYTAVAPDQKTQVEVPADLLLRLQHANVILDRELLKLSARFGITADWSVRHQPHGPRNIELHLGIADPLALYPGYAMAGTVGLFG